MGRVAAGATVLIAVISDTHMPRGERRLPELCVELLSGADLILHAGDLMSEEVLHELRGYGEVCAVHGNVDRPELRQRLPAWRVVETEGVRIGMVHDAGPAKRRLARLRTAFPTEQAVIFGHSHIPLHERSESFQIFNPGSPTERRRAPRHTMGLAEVAEGEVRFELIDLD